MPTLRDDDSPLDPHTTFLLSRFIENFETMTRTVFDDFGYAPSDLELELDLMMGDGEFEDGEFEDEAEAYVGSRRSRRRVNRRSRNYVRWIQRSINQVARQSILKVDGIYGPRTRAAVCDFQRQEGLKVDGIVGPQTERALVRAGACPPPTGSPRRKPRPSTSYGDVSTNTTTISNNNTGIQGNNNVGNNNNIGNNIGNSLTNNNSSYSNTGDVDIDLDFSLFNRRGFPLGRAVAGAVAGSGRGRLGKRVKGWLGRIGRRLFTEMEAELESEGALTPEDRLQVDSYLEDLGSAAANAQTEAEAEALVGAMVPLACELIPRVKPLMMESSPAMVAGLGAATRLLYGDRRTRPLIRTLPTVLHHTAAVLNRDKLNGRKPTPERVVKVLANQAAKVVSSPQQTRRALKHAQSVGHAH